MRFPLLADGLDHTWNRIERTRPSPIELAVPQLQGASTPGARSGARLDSGHPHRRRSASRPQDHYKVFLVDKSGRA